MGIIDFGRFWTSEMDFIFGLILSIFLIKKLLFWRSPLILFGVQYFLGSTLRSGPDSYLINLSWFAILLFSGFAMKRYKVDMCSFYIVTGKVSTVRKVIVSAVFLLLFAFWVQQAGILSFSSMKRVSTSSEFANLANGLLNTFLSPAIAVLMFYRRGNPRWLLTISILIIAVFVVKGFLGSNRGAAIWPLLIVIYARFVQLKQWQELNKFLLILPLFFGAILFFLGAVTAQRAGVDVYYAFALVADHLSSPLGNGYSPLKDEEIIKYVSFFGPFLSLMFILAPFYGFIPRFIWPEKPDVGVGRIVGGDVFGTGGGAYDKGAGIPISITAQFEAMIGYGGYVVGLIFVGLFVAVVAMLTRRYPSLIVSLVLVTPSFMGSDFGRLGMQFIILTLSLFIMQRVLKFRLCHARELPLDRAPIRP